MSLAAAGVLVLALGGAVTLVIYYLRRSIVNAVDLRQADADLRAERERVAAMDAAAAADRARRAQEMDAKTAAATTATDVAKLLHDTVAAGQSADPVPRPKD